jgi:hypothetical protein
VKRNEILKICNIIGSPDEQTWPEGSTLAGAMKYQLLQVNVYPFFVFAVIVLVSNSCVRALFHSDTCDFIRTGMPFVPVCPVFSRAREY